MLRFNKTSLLGSLVIALACTAGCAPAEGDDTATAGGQAQSRASSSELRVGEYEIATESVSGSLTIKSVAPFVFDLTVVRRTGGNNFGDLSDAKATVAARKAVYKEGADCSISIEPNGADLVVKQEGSCSDAGFGASVDATGTYKPMSNAVKVADLGAYELDTPSIHASITITSTTPFIFDLTAVRTSGGNNFGDLQDAKASVADGKATFKEGEDCTISIAANAEGLLVEQSGSCSEAGFGAFVDVSGTYNRRSTTGE